MLNWHSSIIKYLFSGIFLLFIVMIGWNLSYAQKKIDTPSNNYSTQVLMFLKSYCLNCHSTKEKKGSLDLERFGSVEMARKDLKVWQHVIEQIEAGEMPPKDEKQPTSEERKKMTEWIRHFLESEARARVGDPGYVPLRRLSNAEYDATIRELTGVEIQANREFPADGAAGEGFTNAAEALTEISPTLLTKYLNAAKEIADHAVLLPDGFRFSASKTRRDWTDESIAKLKRFYTQFTKDGRLPLSPYLTATIRYRDQLTAEKISLQEVAGREKLNAKFLTHLWITMTDKSPSQPLDAIRSLWRTTAEKDVAKLNAEIDKLQNLFWKVVPIGSYRYGDSRQVPNDPDPKAKAGNDEFRRAFPLFICFTEIVPVDEVVSLKMFHREDEPLERLFLDNEAKQRIDHLWEEHRFISRQPVAENDYLPQFIGFVTQDQPKETLAYFENQRPAFRKRAEELVRDLEKAAPKQIAQLLDFASRAFRRPLNDQQKSDLLSLYRDIRGKETVHEDAFRAVLARVLVSPNFLFRIEHARAGNEATTVDSWELATRLSYFLWSASPDEELRKLAASGKIVEPSTLIEQTDRMLKDARTRSLAIEFGTQWIHVRGFDQFKEKNEKLFPTFDVNLRNAIYEESICFFLDLFQNDRPITNVIDADYTFLNEVLAKHYGIPGVTGPSIRKVDGVRKYGRGGILGLASVQAKEAGASRTSPVLRGNWVVETLLGEKLPRPPANVPRLPEEEGGVEKLTMRQQVERHASVQSCAVCHQRIDPFGFALEKFDPIGRLRDHDLGGLPVDARARLKDGTEFEGIEGLRNYLLRKKKEVIVKLFCRRLLGYALGRSVTLSDSNLLDEMITTVNGNEGRISAAVMTIVKSPQFLKVRGRDYTE